MKNIIYYIRKKQPGLIGDLTEAALAGLKYVGIEFEIKYEDEYEPSELAILFGFHKNVSSVGRIRKIIYDNQELLNKKLMVLERGFLKRDEYHSIGWNGINGRADFNNLNSPDDRFKLLNIDIKPWKRDGKTILVAGQVAWDANLQHINGDTAKKGPDAVKGYLNWLEGLVKDISNRDLLGREIVFRPHPLFRRHEYYREIISENIRWSDKSFEEDLSDAWACFAFNSNSVVEGIVQGVHGFVFDQGSVAYNYTNRSLKNLRKPKKFDREQFFADLGYAQWNLEEISKGLFWKHLNKK